MRKIVLNNGVEMPQIGFGTAYIPASEFSQIIAQAYELGYRQFDTAWSYKNECDLSNAFFENHIKREDVFITTKLSAHALYYGGYKYGKRRILNIPKFKSIRSAVFASLENLNTDYIDLFLVHWPWPMYKKLYKELAKLYIEGRIRAIGVSSFTIGHLESLKDVSDVLPAVNQIEISPLNTQVPLVRYCQDHGIAIEAMSTFSHYHSNEKRQEILENKFIQSIADKYNKTVAQIILKWLIEKNIIIIPKSQNYNHQKENISLFDFSLTREDMKLIDSLDQGKCLNYNPYAPHIVKGIPKKYRHLTPIK